LLGRLFGAKGKLEPIQDEGWRNSNDSTSQKQLYKTSKTNKYMRHAAFVLYKIIADQSATFMCCYTTPAIVKYASTTAPAHVCMFL